MENKESYEVATHSDDLVVSDHQESENDPLYNEHGDDSNKRRESPESHDSDWETDLEMQERSKSFDLTGKRLYFSACALSGVIPMSYFVRHIQDKELILRHHGLGAKGVKAIAIVLVTNTTVLRLDLHDNNIGDLGASHVCEMMKENCYITSLDLSSNKISHVGCAAICDMLNNSGILQDLNIANNAFDDKDAIMFSEIIKNNDQLIKLNMSGNKFCEEGGVALGASIAANDSVEILDLSWNHIRRRGAIGIATGLKNNYTIKVFNLSWNGLEDEGARALSDALKANNTLTELDISNNRISTIGATFIAKSLEANVTIEILKIGDNPIGTAGAHSLLSSLRTRPDNAMHTLCLENIYLDDDFFLLLETLNQEKPLKVVGRIRPSECSPLQVVKQFIAHNYERWFQVFGEYDPDDSGFISQLQFREGLKEINLTFEKGPLAWLCILLKESRGPQINYKQLRT
ncbi:leucine-rich repeat-containing protein 74A-like isoform X2 [Xenia sp. Carnegie-2017]|uniref:leucine-rich repeat-containing protein 74A-like isoform X2 n=1 Tax=Xenia sp. Carnegie-2017 TaxID=2897299 RepID=UPI001F04B081|nr:leucine-rich repeat-containing protein 74A-like isoform X2 [Xenia sp. Carnegie-2017]